MLVTTNEQKRKAEWERGEESASEWIQKSFSWFGVLRWSYAYYASPGFAFAAAYD